MTMNAPILLTNPQPHLFVQHRVLVVDDNVDAAESLAMVLRLTGHEVAVAYDGITALAAARSFRPTAVLLDLGLPGMDGFAVARQLRSEVEFANVLLAAISGYGQDEDRRKSRESGFDMHLVKPVEPDVLQKLLEQSTPGLQSRR